MSKLYIAYAGSRTHVLDGLTRSFSADGIDIIAAKDSFLEKSCTGSGKFTVKTYSSSQEFHSIVASSSREYESGVIISSGVGFRIKIDDYKNFLFLNIHPSLLPSLRGRDPAIGAILKEQPIGATVHVMNNEFDAGKTLWMSEGIDVPVQFDIRDLYAISFIQEFLAGEWLGRYIGVIQESLSDQDYLLGAESSTPNDHQASYFSRSRCYGSYDEKWSNSELCLQVRSCSLKNYGIKVKFVQSNSDLSTIELTLESCIILSEPDQILSTYGKLIELEKQVNAFVLLYWLEGKVLFLRNGDLINATVRELGYYNLHHSFPNLFVASEQTEHLR